METFQRFGWIFPDNHPRLSIRNMAEAGFYRDPKFNDRDVVVCFRCNISLSSWSDDDDPVEEHAHHSPNCGGGGGSNSSSSSNTSYDVCGIYDNEMLLLQQQQSANFSLPFPRIDYMNIWRRRESFPTNLLNIQPNADIKSTIFRTFVYANCNNLAENGLFCVDSEKLNSNDSLTDFDSLIMCYSCGFNLTYTQIIARRNGFRYAHEKTRPDCWHLITTRGIPRDVPDL
nr:inhibitor of apoptosis domain [Apis mellifera nudivirus]